MSKENAVGLLRRRISPDEYEEIRREWIAHSKAEDERDIPGLVSTLTEDCVYIYPQTGDRWEGHEGAEKFYTDLLTAVPDIHFDLQSIVIGPQGVFMEAIATGTPEKKWLGDLPIGEPFRLTTTIYFPWDPEKKKFQGERMFVMNMDGKFPV